MANGNGEPIMEVPARIGGLYYPLIKQEWFSWKDLPGQTIILQRREPFRNPMPVGHMEIVCFVNSTPMDRGSGVLIMGE